jgi:hypothetical protein
MPRIGASVLIAGATTWPGVIDVNFAPTPFPPDVPN